MNPLHNRERSIQIDIFIPLNSSNFCSVSTVHTYTYQLKLLMFSVESTGLLLSKGEIMHSLFLLLIFTVLLYSTVSLFPHWKSRKYSLPPFSFEHLPLGHCNQLDPNPEFLLQTKFYSRKYQIRNKNVFLFNAVLDLLCAVRRTYLTSLCLFKQNLLGQGYLNELVCV